MKVVLAQFIFETNTFNPESVGLEAFKVGGIWLEDAGAIRSWCATTTSQLGESLRELDAGGIAGIPVFAAMCGSPAGRLRAAAWRDLRVAILGAIQRALPADALILHLHGAVCAESEDDVEGDLLEAVRTELGFTGRMVVSLDLHANVTRRMACHADAFTAYRTFPHCDFADTGRRAVGLLKREGDYHRILLKIPALISPTVYDHRNGWFYELLGDAREREDADAIDDISVFPVQPWMDVDEIGSSVLVTNRNPVAARRAALELGRRWWAHRNEWSVDLLEWPAILDRLGGGGGPWYLVDTGDTTTGGSSGRSAEAFRRLLPYAESLPGVVLLWVVDEKTVAGVRDGAEEFEIGEPTVPCRARGRYLGELSCRARGASYTGMKFFMGDAAVLSVDKLRLVVCSRPTIAADPAFYEAAGLDPSSALAVQVKSFSGWQAGFGAGKDRGLYFDGPGATSLDFASLPFRGPARRLYPLNPEAVFEEHIHEYPS